VPSQKLQGQLQREHSVDTSNYGQTQHKVKNKLEAITGGKRTIMQKNKQTNEDEERKQEHDN
jgi:hypothetical protein